MKCLLLAVSLFMLGGTVAHAADLENAALAADQPQTAETAQAPNYGALIIGVTGTTDYLLRGATQTNGNPAIQPFIEYSTPFGFYVGSFVSTVDFSPFDENRWEMNGIVGYRNTFNKVSVDINYWRTYYDETGYFGDALIGSVDYQLTDQFSLGAELTFDFVANDQVLGPRASFTPFETWKVGGKYEFAKDSDVKNWDFGVSKTFDNGNLTFDLRYYDSNKTNGTVVLSMTALFEALSTLSK